ncbi:hypothetical protein [Nocardioides lianchengensis]|uniref:Uncharacterized protein n=1 Tax=Nocardioides lianchengensis TaxID=1045774 RepID=A0A1G6J4G1_9ACTN|nr:hypothetical protein [Nocardioides lianchengensis]NYG12855.1 hypothetical protein [Nocardioides lianchengensis]SDC13688.1 hypothetical protein SAMN05421872_101371 [Nocardioides lianchengensis]
MTFIRRTTKAWIAAAVAGLGYLVPVIDDGMAAPEALGAVLAALVAWQAVYWTRKLRRLALGSDGRWRLAEAHHGS